MGNDDFGMDNPVVRWLLITALSAGVGSTAFTTYKTQDRFYKSDGVRLEAEVNAVETSLLRVEARIDKHMTSHPDRDLQKQINNLEVRLARMQRDG